jgi:undecaprenyl-diphosphatase
VLVLHLAARSFGVWLELPQLFLVYTGGVLLGAAVPTPGGLAGVEAGLVGGFMAYGVGSTTAIAIALAFRLATYWLPILPGLTAFAIYRRRIIT